jgi:hypothetical protein
MQIRLYALGLRGMGRPIEQGSVAYLEDANVRAVSVGVGETSHVRSLAENVVSSMVAGEFAPNKGGNCVECDQKYYCRWGCVSMANELAGRSRTHLQRFDEAEDA